MKLNEVNFESPGDYVKFIQGRHVFTSIHGRERQATREIPDIVSSMVGFKLSDTDKLIETVIMNIATSRVREIESLLETKNSVNIKARLR